ncbi:MAG TPA: glutathione S-transferase C-terminal domain-containing protein [Kineosporiaceae bacterium]|nr:glutathione S-transferase C-terminal domain-containing protein [Kineosporiaceae bacterium]
MTQTGAQATEPRYASAPDVDRYGQYRIVRDPDDPRPLYRFTGRIVAAAADVDEAAGRFVAEPGRYHLYSGWFCPWAQRSTLVVALAGLQDVVSVSYVDGVRDARGWAFREANGPDPVNGFTLLRQAYDATEPNFDGHVSVPALWDRRLRRVLTNDYPTLDADLATEFLAWSRTGVELYPADLRGEIDELERWLLPTVNQGVHRAIGVGEDAENARAGVRAAFETLDGLLADSRYLLGARLTLADVRLFVTLARYDLQPKVAERIGLRLSELPNLWAYARDLYQQNGFRSTTRFSAFVPANGPGVEIPDWDEPVSRSRIS